MSQLSGLFQMYWEAGYSINGLLSTLQEDRKFEEVGVMMHWKSGHRHALRWAKRLQ